ncbi:hypothetical protein DRB96_28200 [Streptomyces sp. ICC1]|nr:hypothetical protein DRB96_28200 [Streptomyces sp. ICC1]
MRMAVPAGVRDVTSGNPDVTLLPALGDALAGAARRYALEPNLYGQEPGVSGAARLAGAGLGADGGPGRALWGRASVGGAGVGVGAASAWGVGGSKWQLLVGWLRACGSGRAPGCRVVCGWGR